MGQGGMGPLAFALTLSHGPLSLLKMRWLTTVAFVSLTNWAACRHCARQEPSLAQALI